jgi:hypothetical protein
MLDRQAPSLAAISARLAEVERVIAAAIPICTNRGKSAALQVLVVERLDGMAGDGSRMSLGE